MTSDAKTPEEYIASLPIDRRECVAKLRDTIRENLPDGFVETMGYGMLTYAVPLSTYPAGYHVGKDVPLGLISVASQKNFIAVYHMGVACDPKLDEWFRTEYAKRVAGKLDMGKSCIRFKKPESIPFDLIGELAAKLTPEAWIEIYEKGLGRR